MLKTWIIWFLLNYTILLHQKLIFTSDSQSVMLISRQDGNINDNLLQWAVLSQPG